MRAGIALLVFAGLAAAEVTIPDGTRLRVRLDQTISSGTADEGQAVELSVTEPVKIGDQVVIPEGARVTGTITMAQEKRHMGRAGKLDFSIDRVRAIDGDWIPLRYTVNKKSGGSHAVSTGVLTAGAAVLFWPAAPAFLLIKGKDVTINKGVVFDTFTDRDHVLSTAAAAVPPAGMRIAGATGTPGGAASVTITSNAAGAEIEVDGAFVGSTPTTLSLASGTHQIAVRNGSALWQRNLQVSAGSNITVNAQMQRVQSASTRLQ
ncbi:MAG: PEGA domain-containing protein [Acidobacteriaceae bacterium]|nr:PEGA domain-containing protein [Acidobacteriaceae bacterium]